MIELFHPFTFEPLLRRRRRSLPDCHRFRIEDTVLTSDNYRYKIDFNINIARLYQYIENNW